MPAINAEKGADVTGRATEKKFRIAESKLREGKEGLDFRTQEKGPSADGPKTRSGQFQ